MLFSLSLLLVLLILAGIGLLQIARQIRSVTGVPEGDVVYSDTGRWRKQSQPLRSRRHGLVGRPDYLVEVGQGRRSMLVPVEVKSRSQPPVPYAGHILQLATYCLLVEDCYRRRPEYGLLRYADATLKIPYTDALRSEVLTAAAAIRQARTSNNVHRQHADAPRCLACGYRHGCSEAL